MELFRLLNEKGYRPSLWAEFRHGFWVELAYLPLPELRAMIAGNKRLSFSKDTQRLEEVLDEEGVRAGFCELILNWRGLNPEVVARLVPVKAEDVKDDIPCTPANKLALMEHCHGFLDFVQKNVIDLALFQEKRLEEEVSNLISFRNASSCRDEVEL